MKACKSKLKGPACFLALEGPRLGCGCVVPFFELLLMLHIKNLWLMVALLMVAKENLMHSAKVLSHSCVR